MLRFDDATSDELALFRAFGLASYRAQDFEALLIQNLQFALALAGAFASLEEIDRAAAKHNVMPMGQVFARLSTHVDDAELVEMIQRAIFTRNQLTHHFFRVRRAGTFMTGDEIAEAVNWCEDAASEFEFVSTKLQARWHVQVATLAVDPDRYVPGMRSRLSSEREDRRR